MEHEISQISNGFDLFMKEAARQDSSTARIPKNSLAYFRAVQGHSGGIAIDPELRLYILIPYSWKQYLFHKVALSAFNLSMRTE